MSMYDIKLFSIKDLRDWLVENQHIEGLNENIVSHSRAYAIVHNPYVNDHDHVVSAIYENDEIAAYTAAFPDMVEENRVWWFTTLWCNPKYRGKGYGLLVVGSLCEEYGKDCVFDLWGAPETVAIFDYLGLNTSSIPEYHLEEKRINLDSFRGKVANMLQLISRCFNSKIKQFRRIVSSSSFSLQYVNYIDKGTYSFIQHHSEDNVFPRTREMMNWLLRYPFIQVSPIKGRVKTKTSFPDISSSYQLLGVRVFSGANLIGFYILGITERGVAIKYIYYDQPYEDVVFHSIGSHIIVLHPHRFVTRCKALFQFIKSYSLFPNTVEHQISISYPKSFSYNTNGIIQAGDGDNFV